MIFVLYVYNNDWGKMDTAYTKLEVKETQIAQYSYPVALVI